MLNDNGTFMSFKSFKEKFGIKTDYIYSNIGCVQAIKSYICKTEITVEGKNSADLMIDFAELIAPGAAWWRRG